MGLLSRFVHIVLIVAATSLAGCDRAPTDEKLAADLSAYVEAGYAPGLLEVVHATRTDHGALTALERQRRVIPFAADLRLARNHDFGTWDQASARALSYRLGAVPESLSGLKTGGNKAGDIIHLNGAVVYRRTNDEWRLEAGIPPRPETTSLPSAGVLAYLRQFGRLTRTAFDSIGSPARSIAREDLALAAARISAHKARLAGGMAIASGPEGGSYWRIAEAVVNTGPSQSQIPMVNLATSGSRASLHLLRDATVTAALMRSDEAGFAATGTGPFEQDGTFPALRALASLFPEQIHVVAMVGSSIASVADLYGKRVAVSAGSSASLATAGDVLRAHRVPMAALAAAPIELPTERALEALIKGEVDAVIITSPAPTPALHDFAVAHPVRLLPLDGDAIAFMTTGTSSYAAITMPAQTYPRQDRPIATVGLTVLLVTTSAVPAAETEALLKTVFGGVDFLGQGSALGTMIGLNTAQRGVTLALHPGAEAFFGIPAAQK